MQTIAQGRTNVAPHKLPWDLLRSLITEIYGGKIDDEDDIQTLRDIVNRVMDPSAYETDHRLVHIDGRDPELEVPAGTTLSDFRAWIGKLPEREPPTYLGLPANAEKLLLIEHGRCMIEDLAKTTGMLGDGGSVL